MAQPHNTELSSSQHSAESAGQFDARELISLLSRDLKQVERHLAEVSSYVSSPETRNIAQAAGELRDSITAFLENAKQKGTAITSEAKEKTEALHKEMEKHPVAAASSAFALGYFLGRTVFGHKRHAANS